MEYTNKLIHESSPYLLQHAHNPVDWYPWSEEALAKAKEEDKIILASVGYAACHWCHVMERESFEDTQIAALMNKHFVCIKIDREERPDLDHLFMDALQLISGNGGWPLNMFLTPEAKPFYGGTYFPPKDHHHLISWQNLLVQLQQAFITRRKDIEDQAAQLQAHLESANKILPEKKLSFGLPLEEKFTLQQTQKIRNHLMSVADPTEGGFSRAPKFPQTFSIIYLMRYHHFYGDQEGFDQAMLSLRKMIRGGINDQIGGGFCRYATDPNWMIPHFEKMAYDNALLLMALSEAYKMTGVKEIESSIKHTISFLQREMLDLDGLYYAALDADSEGVEGKFYTWTYAELENVLGDDTVLLASYFKAIPEGNWEGTNILHVEDGIEEWSQKHGIEVGEAQKMIGTASEKLMNHRSKRIRPGTDDKKILGWNALINQGMVHASLALQKEDWLSSAVGHMDKMLETYASPNFDEWCHTYKKGELKFNAYLDDLGYLIQALILISEAGSRPDYLLKARKLLEYTIEKYSDEEGLFFYFTPEGQNDLLIRKKDFYDGATPSGNAVMAQNLYKLGIFFDEHIWQERAAQMLEIQKDMVVKYPNSFGIWASLLLEFTKGTNEIAVIGPDAASHTFSLLKNQLPNRVIMASSTENALFPLLKGKIPDNQVKFFLCEGYSCKKPLNSSEELLKAINC